MTHPITRRDFLKVSGGFTGLIATAGFLGNASDFSDLRMTDNRPRWSQESKTICSLDSCNCGLICYTNNQGQLTNLEGDPDNPMNKGAACSKGASLITARNGKDFNTVNPYRIQRVLYRAAGADKWEEKDWNWTFNTIASKVKATRDAGYTASAARCDSIASFGGATLFNEECHMLSKALRALGLVYIDNQDRYDSANAVLAGQICTGNHASANPWTDLGNANCILCFGASPLDSYAASSYHINDALNAETCKLITVDPRFTRTAAKSNLYVPMRSGADLAFLGGLIRYILEQISDNPDSYNMDFLRTKTNAGALVNADFQGPADLDGLFSGYNNITKLYDKSTWAYQTDDDHNIKYDSTLEDDDCVFQIMKKHFNRYSISNVSNITGADAELLIEAYALFTATGTADKAGAIIHSMGATQHTNGAQIIHALNIIQLLLGNMGVAGGGIHTIRGEGNTQGNADFGLSADTLPGYLPMPTVNDNYASYTSNTNAPAFVSLMKSWFGSFAAADNDFCFDYLPKKDPAKNYTALAAFEAMAAGQIKGAFCWGQNVAVSSPNIKNVTTGFDKLDWLVVVDKWENETAAFWKRPGITPANIDTEVFLLPCAASFEKEGSTTNSSRLIQWSAKAVNTPGDAKAEFEIINSLMTAIKSAYSSSGGMSAASVSSLTWSQSSANAVLRDINGTVGSAQISTLAQLKSDGSTACGNCLYTGVSVDQTQLNAFERDHQHIFLGNIVGNRAARVYAQDVDNNGNAAKGMYAYYGYSWPQNERILPLNTADGRGVLFSQAFVDGPLPEHYEPWESPVTNLLSVINTNPVLFNLMGNQNPQGTSGSYPIVATTFRNVEHCMDGQTTRNLPWLVEMMPQAYAEISRELAEKNDIESGDLIDITSARGTIRVRAMVTARLTQFKIQNRAVDQIAIPWQWGFMGHAYGDSANLLTPSVCDGNTFTPEYKAFLVKIAKVS